MKKLETNRVLNRIGARELTPREAEIVSGGGPFHTNNCTAINPKTGKADGDAC
jgi:hypothetical protein